MDVEMDAPATVPMRPDAKIQLVIAVVLVAVALLVLALRFATRLRTRSNLWWDDWLCLASLIWCVGALVIQGMLASHGSSYNVDEVMYNIVIMGKLIMSLEFVYSISMSLAKLSVLTFYLRCFSPHRGMRIASWACIAVVCAWTLANVAQPFAVCRPLPLMWDPRVPGQCGDRKASFIAIGAFSVVTDGLVLFLPIPTIVGLQMRKRSKVALIVVMLLGLVVTVAAGVRIYYLDILDPTGNFSANMAPSVFLTTVEPALSVISISLPMLGPLLDTCLGGARRRALRYIVSGSGSNSNSSEAMNAKGGKGRGRGGTGRAGSPDTTGHASTSEFAGSKARLYSSHSSSSAAASCSEMSPLAHLPPPPPPATVSSAGGGHGVSGGYPRTSAEEEHDEGEVYWGRPAAV